MQYEHESPCGKTSFSSASKYSSSRSNRWTKKSPSSRQWKTLWLLKGWFGESRSFMHPLTSLLLFRNRLEELRNQLTPIRTTLITTLSAIYPIDLLSPPDLLFTILSAPLPIPLTASDPGPPLSLPDHKEVNEDAIATALGYAAQVIHFLAVYLGKTLVYPVTCIGSRSLIRDGISAMVGPRMYV